MNKDEHEHEPYSPLLSLSARLWLPRAGAVAIWEVTRKRTTV